MHTAQDARGLSKTFLGAIMWVLFLQSVLSSFKLFAYEKAVLCTVLNTGITRDSELEYRSLSETKVELQGTYW